MADYYIMFSVLIERISDEELQWFRDELARGEKILAEEDEPKRLELMEELQKDYEDADPDYWPDFRFDTRDAEKEEARPCWVWLYSEGNGILDHAVRIIERWLAKFRPNEAVGFEWSASCSKPRTDAYGGGAVYITASETKWMTTWDWIQERETERREELEKQ